MTQGNAPRDGHSERIPAKALDVILSQTRRKAKAKRIIRECMVDGKPYHAAAVENGLSRQYVWEICLDALARYRRSVKKVA